MYHKPNIDFNPATDDNGQQLKDHKNRYIWVASTKCPFCNKHHEVCVDGISMMAYMRGTRVNVAFKEYSENYRELFISGLCEECWNALFAPDDPETSHQQDYLQEDE